MESNLERCRKPKAPRCRYEAIAGAPILNRVSFLQQGLVYGAPS